MNGEGDVGKFSNSKKIVKFYITCCIIGLALAACSLFIVVIGSFFF